MPAFTCESNCDFTQARNKSHLLHHIHNAIPTRIGYAEMTNLLPTRDDFLDKELVAHVAGAVSRNAPLLFMPNAIHEKNEYVRDGYRSDPLLRIHIFGTLPCGSKTAVILEDIPVYVLVALPKNEKKAQFKSIISDMLHTRNVNTLGGDWVKKYKIRGFQQSKHDWLKYSFNNLQDRKKFLDNIATLNKSRGDKQYKVETANDDTGFTDFYFQVVARQHGFNTADWNRFEKYESIDPLPHCRYTFRVRLADYVKLPAERRRAIEKTGGKMADVLTRDNTLYCMWDIETWQRIQTGQPADPDDTDLYKIFMLCSGWAWQWQKEPFVNFCCVDVTTPPRADVGVIIQCSNERENLLAHTEVLSRMAPDLIGAFNGGCFDWPCYRAKMRSLGLLYKIRDALSCVNAWTRQGEQPATTESNIDKWSFRKESVKIDAENNHDLKCVAVFPGIIDTDILPIFLKLYSRAEVPKLASMNFFLEKNKLPAKADMPYKRMFRIYERAKKFDVLSAKRIECHCKDGVGSRVIVDKTEEKDTPHRYCDCKNHVRDLDYQPIEGLEGAFPGDDEYTDDLFPEIDDRCCWCTKRERNLADMADVAYYCVIDCVRPQQLIGKRVIVSEKRELSTMSCVSLYDSYYRADGMKVRNVIGKYAHKFDIAFSNAKSNKSEKEKDHYPGAWVCIPERKLNFDDPVSGMDYSSLYPSLMMTYNLSIDMVVYEESEAKRLASEGYNIHQVGPFNHERGEKRGAAVNTHHTAIGWMVRHSGITKKTDTTTIATYRRHTTWKHKDEASNPTVKYTTDDTSDEEHDANIAKYETLGYKAAYAYEPIYGREKLEGERMGLFPYILKKLFDKRKPIKAKYLYWSNIIDEMEKAGAHEWTVDGVTFTEDDLDFYKNTVDSKQKAIKVLANTFYGESGNFRSPIFEILVAAGTTTAGVANITKVRHMVMEKGCHVHYGDTDSLYISPPRRLFLEHTEAYELELAQITEHYRGVKREIYPADGTPEAEYKRKRIDARLKLMEIKVRMTMKYMNDLKDYISLFLMRDNGTCFLNMAYEEVGLPTWFLGKKKYIMAPHMLVINFYPKTYFMRGIDIIKQGQTALAVEMGTKYIRDNMLPENEDDIIPLMERVLRKFCTDDIPVEKFAQKAKYKPEKQNIPVKRFIERMKLMQERYHTDEKLAKVYALPDPGDKFTYIIAKKDTPFNIRGKKIELKKGDRMEFLRAYQHSRGTATPLEIDANWYMESSISGILARFIAGLPQFVPPEGKHDTDTKEGYKKMDEECIKAASAWIMNYCNNITGTDPKRETRYGADYRKRYNAAKKHLIGDAVARHGTAGDFYYQIIEAVADESPELPPLDMFVRKILELARNVESDAEFINEMIAEGSKPHDIWHRHVSPRNPTAMFTMLYRSCDHDDKELERRLYRVANRFAGSADDTITVLRTFIDAMVVHGRSEIDSGDINMINNWKDTESVDELFDVFCRLRANERIRRMIVSGRRIVECARNQAAGYSATPATTNARELASRARADAKKSATRQAFEIQWD